VGTRRVAEIRRLPGPDIGVHPIAIEMGQPPFRQKIKLKLASVKVYGSGVVRQRYQPADMQSRE
jgi:hypothetical protein